MEERIYYKLGNKKEFARGWGSLGESDMFSHENCQRQKEDDERHKKEN